MWMRVIGEFFLAFQFWCNIMRGTPAFRKAWGISGIQGEKEGMKDPYETGVEL